MMIRLWKPLAAAVLACLAFAQDKPLTESPNREAVIIPVKTLSGDAFTRLANMLQVFNVPYRADEKLRTIIVYAPKDVAAQIRAVVEQLDRPGSEAAVGRNVDMTLSFVLCSTKDAPPVRPLPADLEAVGRQLRAAGLCKDAALLDTVPLRVQEGKESRQTATVPGFPSKVPDQTVTLQLDIRPEAIVRKEADRYVRFAKVSVYFQMPYPGVNSSQFQFRNVGIDTAGDFKEGQKTVLGKISGVDSDSALFVVISLKILD